MNNKTYNTAIMADIAMQMYTDVPGALARLGADWKVLGTLIASDAVLKQPHDASTSPGVLPTKVKMQLGGPVFFGFLARNTESPTNHVCVVRGTDRFAEWVDDAEFTPVHHPVIGMVEAGFFGIYQSMRFQDPPANGAVAFSRPVLNGIINVVGDGTLTVIGHSLGAALATYLSFDLYVALQHKLQVSLLASPQPGNVAFCNMYDHLLCGSYSLSDYELDVVPRVPFGPDYEALPERSWITPKSAKARIKFGLACNHHALSYAAMLDYAAQPDWLNNPCVKGPNP